MFFSNKKEKKNLKNLIIYSCGQCIDVYRNEIINNIKLFHGQKNSELEFNNLCRNNYFNAVNNYLVNNYLNDDTLKKEILYYLKNPSKIEYFTDFDFSTGITAGMLYAICNYVKYKIFEYGKDANELSHIQNYMMDKVLKELDDEL